MTVACSLDDNRRGHRPPRDRGAKGKQGGRMDPAMLTIFIIAILIVVAIAAGAFRKGS
jgi:hypothetical protein